MAMPALLMSTLTGPSAASAPSIAFAIEAVSVTSICTATARPPWAKISSSRLLSLAVWRGAMRGQHPGELPAQPLRGAGDENDIFTDVEYVRHDELREDRGFIDTDDF